MIKGVDHIGIIVRDIENSLDRLSRIVDFPEPAITASSQMQMTAALVDLGNLKLEFLQAEAGNRLFADAAKRNADTIHHFCLLSDDIDMDVEGLKAQNIEMLDQKPTVGIRGKRRAMSKPSALNGVSIELSEP